MQRQRFITIFCCTEINWISSWVLSSLFFWSGVSRAQGLSILKALKLLSYCVLGNLSVVGVQEWLQSTLLVQCWHHLQLHMFVMLLLQTRRCLEARTNYLSIYFNFEFGCAYRHSCRFIQVPLHIPLQTTNGGKRLTKNFRHGLALLVPQWSWTLSAAKITLSSLD